MMKKMIFMIVGLIFLSCFYGRFDIQTGFVPCYAYAETSESEDLEKELTDEVNKQLSNLDFSSIETTVDALTETAKNLFSANSFTEKLNSVISGGYVDSSQNFFSAVMSIFWSGLKDVMPIVASIISISILSGMISNLKPITNGKSIENLVHFVSYGIVIIFLGSSLVQIVKTTTLTLSSIKEIFDGIFPILLTLLTAVGGTVSVGIYQPAIALLSNIFIGLISYVLMPMFIFSLIFSIVGNLSQNVKLDKFVSFLQGTFKWVIGLGFTVFLGFVSIQGIMAGAVDGLSIKTAKYAIKSYIPIVGGYVSDGFSIITASSGLIKNSVGGVGLFLLFSIAISPIINLVIFMLALKFIAGIIEPIGDKQTANFVSEIAKSITMLIALLVAVIFMYTILTGLIMCSANLV